MMNQDNPYAMNQTCKVCGEPAAGFHFGAFTCEGCKSFFGRSYNNLSSISDCKNNGECIINKKNRTACKACRLRKCLMVGMSKSGSRYGRRSNWFKIHCLLQEQQQQAAAAMAAHQNQQQQQQAAHHHGSTAGGMHVKPPGIPPPAAAAAALGMLGHAGAYPGLYPPRTKEEFMMLSLEEYSKHSVASPSVSSPDSHNSDSSVEVNGRSVNPSLLHLSAKHGALESASSSLSVSATGPAVPHAMRKDLPPFLPLSFPALSSMPVMPPPSFLPPSHLLFPGYHPALYQHAHAGLLKPSPEQQAAAAAMHHLFQNSNRFPSAPLTPTESVAHKSEEKPQSPRSDSINNNHIPNGSKAAEELTKRFYLDAVLKSQQAHTPPPITQVPALAPALAPAPAPAPAAAPVLVTKLPHLSKHDHSITALVTPNSESGRAHNTSRLSNEEDDVCDDDKTKMPMNETFSNGHDSEGHNNTEEDDEEEDEDLVVSMTPPRSPIEINDCGHSNSGEGENTPQAKSSEATAVGQDNPIDLSMKAVSSVSSSVSNTSANSLAQGKSKCDSLSDQENDLNDSNDKVQDLWKTHEIIKTPVNNNNNNNNNENEEKTKSLSKGMKREHDEEGSSIRIAEEMPAKLAKLDSSVLDLTRKM